jgi:hypothetical protein
MALFNNRSMEYDTAEIDVDVIAFNVTEKDAENVANYLAATIMARCMMDYGIAPIEFE